MSTKVARTLGHATAVFTPGRVCGYRARDLSAACPAPHGFIAFCGGPLSPIPSRSDRSIAPFMRVHRARAHTKRLIRQSEFENPPNVRSNRLGSRSCEVANLGSSATTQGIAAMVWAGSVT